MLEVVTWNVDNFRAPGGTRFDLVEELAASGAARADLVALQEAAGAVPPAAALRDRFGYRDVLAWDVAEPGDSTVGCTRIAVLSRFPVRSVERRLFPSPDLRGVPVTPGWTVHRKGVLLVRVDTPAGPVVFGSLHLYPFHHFGCDARDRRYAGIRDAVREVFDDLAGSTFVVAGDFNAEDRALLVPHRDDGSPRSAFAGVATRPNGRSHDDVVYSPDLALRERRVLDGPSDHYPCVARLTGGEHRRSRRSGWRSVSPVLADSGPS